MGGGGAGRDGGETEGGRWVNGGVESGLFHVSGSRWHSADVHGDKNRELPCEAQRADARQQIRLTGVAG